MKEGFTSLSMIISRSIHVAANGIASFLFMKENPPANAGDIRDADLISGSGRSPGVGHVTYCSILAWRIPWTEEPGRLQSIGS